MCACTHRRLWLTIGHSNVSFLLQAPKLAEKYCACHLSTGNHSKSTKSARSSKYRMDVLHFVILTVTNLNEEINIYNCRGSTKGVCHLLETMLVTVNGNLHNWKECVTTSCYIALGPWRSLSGFLFLFSGDMLRAVIASGSPLGSKIKKVSLTVCGVWFYITSRSQRVRLQRAPGKVKFLLLWSLQQTDNIMTVSTTNLIN